MPHRTAHFLLCLAIGTTTSLATPIAPPDPVRVIESSAPAVSPDGSRIAFVSKRDGAIDLYVSSPDGTDEVRLTRTPEEEGPPNWSADGKQIRFAVSAGDASRVYAVDPEGKNQHQIGGVPGRNAVVSPDGTHVLYATGPWTAVRLFVSSLDGSQPRPLSDGSSVLWNPRWSPDGKSIAFTGRDAQGQLYVATMNADGSERRQVTHLPVAEGNAQVPAWSPDGRQLAFQVSSRSREAHSSHIWIVDQPAP